MHFAIIRRILGLLLIIYSFTLIPPMLVSLIYLDDALQSFVWPMGIMFGIGGLLWLSALKAREELQGRDGFFVVVGFWTVLSLVSALPFIFHGDLTLAKAVFEAVSGFTTTGATVLTDIESLPASLLYYRQQLQLLGGLGVIVLAIAVLPMLGIGGLQLYRAEAPGPMRDDKLTPRLAQTAKSLLYLYLGLTLACAIAYKLAGMSLFDAITHSYTTVSTSGFSTHNESMGYFDSPLIEVIAMLFMLLGSLNFTIHYMALNRRNIMHYWEDMQGRVFIYIVLILVGLCTITLLWTNVYEHFWQALRYASFQIISIITTTGYTTTDYSIWPVFLPVLVFGCGFIGGCVGSTAGGFRVMRVILLYKQGMREIMRLIHPNAVIPVRIGSREVPTRVAEAVWGFAFLYVASFLFLSMVMLTTGLDIVSAFAATAACLNTIGPGLGQVATDFSRVSDFGLWVSSFTMVLGRLEIFTLLVLLMPAFWSK